MTQEVLDRQTTQALSGLSTQQAASAILAYEPVWAIGTGRTATPEIAQDVHYLVRAWLGERFSREVPGRVRILYGGSVKPDNVVELMKQDDIDGALVGGASLEAASFAKLARFAELE
jgi:triosephosphate isomerase